MVSEAGVVSVATEGVDELVPDSLEGGGGEVGPTFSFPSVGVNELFSADFRLSCVFGTGDNLASPATGTFSLFFTNTSSSSRSFAESAPEEAILSKFLTIGERVLIGVR